MQIKIWIRTASADDDSPTMRVDSKMESRDTPVIQRYARKLMVALGWDQLKPDEEFVVHESNGEIINALHELANGSMDGAIKRIKDGDISQMLLDAAVIVEKWTIEHGDFRKGGK